MFSLTPSRRTLKRWSSLSTRLPVLHWRVGITSLSWRSSLPFCSSPWAMLNVYLNTCLLASVVTRENMVASPASTSSHAMANLLTSKGLWNTSHALVAPSVKHNHDKVHLSGRCRGCAGCPACSLARSRRLKKCLLHMACPLDGTCSGLQRETKLTLSRGVRLRNLQQKTCLSVGEHWNTTIDNIDRILTACSVRWGERW